MHVSCDMFLVTFACANECFSGENNLENHPVIEFSFYVEGLKEFKLDTFCITDREMSYEMVALYVSGKVSNYFRHYANSAHLLQLKQIQNHSKGLNLLLSS